MRPTTWIVAGALLAGTARAQEHGALLAVRLGRLAEAVAALDAVGSVGDAAARVELCTGLAALARDAGAAGDHTRTALRHALRLCADPVPSALADARAAAARSAARQVVEILRDDASRLPDGRLDRTFFADALAARSALHPPATDGDAALRTWLDVELAPLLLELNRHRELALHCEQALAGSLAAEERALLRSYRGRALLRLRRFDLALPYLESLVETHLRRPEVVAEELDRVPLALAADTYRLLQPVLARPPASGQDSGWTSCLQLGYRLLDNLPADRPQGEEPWRERIVRRELPREWPGQRWGPGYRTWIPDDARQGKDYEGRHAVRAALPISGGWRRVNRPPEDLARWGNHAIVLRRGGEDGAVLVIWWFGPSVDYWYGHTPRAKGVTAKTVRGFNRQGVASMVARTAYGADAKLHERAFDKAAPLPFRPGVAGTRMAWRLGDHHYDETFASLGQFTIEILLRIRDDELELLRPEIEWLYRHVDVE